ncbi:MAG: mercury(II) reductase [Deltaproteobacteria bacterium]|nr:MAG: mercury(II) reductase [Deltaproteobacteria bacterium]
MSDCCTPTPSHAGKHLVIVGGGSAAFAAAIAALDAGARVTLVNDGLPIGGTCVNVGCVPSKALIEAAAAVAAGRRRRFGGITVHTEVTSTATVLEEVRNLVGRLRSAKYEDVVAGRPGFSRIDGRARLVGPSAVVVAGTRIEGDAIVVATGARPHVPEVPGAAEAPPLTNESFFDLAELPRRVVVVGGSFVGLEFAQALARLGTRVTLVEAADRLLSRTAPDVGAAVAAALAADGVEILVSARLEAVARGPGGVEVVVDHEGTRRRVQADAWLAATGRVPNTEGLGLDELGVATDARGFVEVDAMQRTRVPTIFAAGDVTGGDMFVYTAAREGTRAARNALGAAEERPPGPVPWVVFTDPQVAGVGLDLDEAVAAGIDAQAARLPLEHLPRAIVARRPEGFVRLVRDCRDDRIVGARIVAPTAGDLVVEAALAVAHGWTAADLRDAVHPYLTHAEALGLAATTFVRPVHELSCCAS